MFALIVFVRLKGDLSLLDDEQTMDELMSLLKINNFEQEMQVILVNLRSIFITASKMIENTR